MVSRLDRSPVANWWWTIDRWFLAAFLSLMGLGIVLSFAASTAVAERIGLDSFHFATRQIIFMIPALAAMLGVSFLDARQVRRLALAMLALYFFSALLFRSGVEKCLVILEDRPGFSVLAALLNLTWELSRQPHPHLTTSDISLSLLLGPGRRSGTAAWRHHRH